MIGRVEVSDSEIADAVAAVEDDVLALLGRLVEAPTTLGNEEPGQELMEHPGTTLEHSFACFSEWTRTIRLMEATPA